MRGWLAGTAGLPGVLVRFVRTEVFDDLARACRARLLLDADEIEEMGRLRAASVRRDYLAAHALAHTMLAELSGCRPQEVRLRRSLDGRLEFDPPPGAPRLHLSLAHADGIALCAVSEACEVGADVESLHNTSQDPLVAAEFICTRRERAWLHTLPARQRPASLLSLWTRKEAVAKAIGRALPLARIAVDEPRDTFGVLWRIVSLCPTPFHLAAIALLGTPTVPPAVRLEEAVLGQAG